MVVIAMVAFDIKDEILSDNITFIIICNGEASMLCAISIVLGLTSLRLVSVSLAINGKAAMTVDAVVPTTVPTINLVNGKTSIINIRNDTERSRLINKFKIRKSHFGIGNTPSFSSTTSKTPRGSPIRIANTVASIVT